MGETWRQGAKGNTLNHRPKESHRLETVLTRGIIKWAIVRPECHPSGLGEAKLCGICLGQGAPARTHRVDLRLQEKIVDCPKDGNGRQRCSRFAPFRGQLVKDSVNHAELDAKRLHENIKNTP